MGNGERGNRIDIVSTAEGDYIVSTSTEGEPSSHASPGDAASAGTRQGSAQSSQGPGSPGQRGSAASRRPWVGIHFDCCDVYQRVYRKPDDDCYLGFCPKCGRRIRLRVGADGVNAKFFRATPG